MTWVETFERIATHCTAMAMTPGFWQYAQARVIELESEQGGCWKGLRAEVGKRIKAAGFRPAPSDLTGFERVVEPLPPGRRRYGG